MIGDPLGVIASGPCFPDSFSQTDFLAIMHKYGIIKLIPESLVDTLLQNCSNTPQSIDEVTSQHVIVGSIKFNNETQRFEIVM